ncbi:unnamed protein product, partial [Urochloa humidicola]
EATAAAAPSTSPSSSPPSSRCPATELSKSKLLTCLCSALHHSLRSSPRSAPFPSDQPPRPPPASSRSAGRAGHRPAMTSAVATTVGCGGIPFRPSSAPPRGRPRGRWVVRAQAAGADASEDKSVEIMRKFSEQYARRSNTFFCADKTVTAVVIKGLADHKDTLGAPLCPCRHYDDKAGEVAQGFWNCPCVPMRERKECHCMLFLTPDNDFAGKDQAISLEEIKEATSKF